MSALTSMTKCVTTLFNSTKAATRSYSILGVRKLQISMQSVLRRQGTPLSSSKNFSKIFTRKRGIFSACTSSKRTNMILMINAVRFSIHKMIGVMLLLGTRSELGRLFQLQNLHALKSSMRKRVQITPDVCVQLNQITELAQSLQLVTVSEREQSPAVINGLTKDLRWMTELRRTANLSLTLMCATETQSETNGDAATT